MSCFSAIILGLIQGVTEFLPISSSGHLAVAQNLLGLSIEGVDDAFFDILLHLGTLAAVFAAYWEDLRRLAVAACSSVRDLGRPVPRSPQRHLLWMLVVGTLPLIAVLPVKDFVERLSGNMWFVGTALTVTGMLLFACDRVQKGRKSERTATMLDALLVGVGQAIATVPGISRSGMTICAGCFRGFERSFSVRFAFLLSIPAVLGANVLSISDALAKGIEPALLPVYGVGVLAAAISGYCSIVLVRFVTNKARFDAFAYYCWAAGLVTLILTFLQ